MGTTTPTQTSIVTQKFLHSLTTSTPLKHTEQAQTQVHEISYLSPQHHHIMLEKIRVKKNYDCPFIIKIIDSHTLESKSLCSTIIKTYIVVEKPQSLAEEIQQRLGLRLGFQETEIWTLIYSCCMGASYLLKNNVGLSRVNTSKIFIDLKGGIKINDPDFSEGCLSFERVQQSEFVRCLGQVARELTCTKKMEYSSSLIDLITMMSKFENKLCQIQDYVNKNYIQNRNQTFRVQGFSSTKKAKLESGQKQKLRVLSGRKKSIQTNKSHARNQTSDFSNFNSQFSYKSIQEDKENVKDNEIITRRSRMELFTFKDSMKDLENLNNKQIPLQSHLFPKKALFGQKKRSNKLSQLTNEHSNSIKTQRQTLTRQSHSLLAETDPSLDGSQLLNMISSYQVDQETFVREVCQEQSEYFLELLNHAKSKSGHSSHRKYQYRYQGKDVIGNLDNL